MDIGPVKHPLPGYQVKQKSPDRQDGSEPKGSETKDRVEISLEARRRLSQTADQALKGENDTREEAVKGSNGQIVKDDFSLNRANSLDQIRARIESGYYDRSDVREEIIDRLSDDMKS